MDIREIRLEHIREYINRLGVGLSASAIKKQKLMLSQVLKHACEAAGGPCFSLLWRKCYFSLKCIAHLHMGGII